jgi:hypothetical protein
MSSVVAGVRLITFCGAVASVTVVPSSPVTATVAEVGEAAVVAAVVARAVDVATGEAAPVGAEAGVDVGWLVAATAVGATDAVGGVCVGLPVPWHAVASKTAAATNENPFTRLRKGVRSGALRMGAFPFLTKESGTTMGPATGLTTLTRRSP